jgi:signal transduction histidine kinase
MVKNAYDADATQAIVQIDLRNGRSPSIIIIDDGDGMAPDTIRDVWLVPGADHRSRQRRERHRTPRFRRLPLGEKGLGRFAVHKLGSRVRVVTRARDHAECVIDIDWEQLAAKPFLDEAFVRIELRDPEVFQGEQTGTRIDITSLRNAEWTRSRRELRRLYAQITSICSPFEAPDSFAASLRLPGRNEWIADLPDIREILNRAFWRFTFRLEDGRFDWAYEFREIPGLKLASRTKQGDGDRLKLPPRRGRDDQTERNVTANPSTTKGIGPAWGKFHVYDRDREVLQLLPNMQLMTEYLDENGGVRVYRDGIRVYNYGEPGDDWLGLDLRRVNIPTRRISRNIIIGAVHLSLEHSLGLLEKTNREGFVENDAYEQFQRIVLGALGTLESERQIDKERIRELTHGPREPSALPPVVRPIAELRRELDRRGLRRDLEPYVARIEHDYTSMQETLLSAGMSGLNLAVIFHEVERGVRMLHRIIADGTAERDAVARQARDLMHLLEGFSALLRRDSRSTQTARSLVRTARQFNTLRFQYHRIRLLCPFLEGDDPGFEARFSFSLVLGALNNIIDNSLYWLRVRWPDVTADPSPRRLYIGVSMEYDAGPAIVVADNGPGFQDDPPDLVVRPFFTRKPNGMGLGLYYSTLAMQLNGGTLVIPRPGELDLPPEFDGATVALVFNKPR